jgi:hypothetical protein
MDSLITEQKIDDNIGRVCINIKDYSEKNFKEDVAELFDYHANRKDEDETGKDFTALQLGDPNILDYKKSLGIIKEYFSKVLLRVIEENKKELFLSKEFNLQIHLIRIPEREYYFEFDSKASDENNACFDGSGLWFLQTLVFPLTYSGKINYRFIERYFLHEFVHWQDFCKGKLDFKEEKKKKIVQQTSVQQLNFLYTSLINLRLEGLADFVSRKGPNGIDLNLNGIKKYNHNLKKLTKKTSFKASEAFYENDIGYGNVTPTGEYANGRMMCLTIAVALAKEKKITLQFISKKESFTDYSKIDHMLHRHDEVKVLNIPDAIFSEAIKDITPTSHYYFVKLYEKACDILGIREKYRVMTVHRFYDLRKQAIETSMEKERKRLHRKYTVLPPKLEENPPQ